VYNDFIVVDDPIDTIGKGFGDELVNA